MIKDIIENKVFNRTYFTGKDLLDAYNSSENQSDIKIFKTLEEFIDKAIDDAWERGRNY